MRKIFTIVLALSLFATSVDAAGDPALWLRKNAVSPDGSQIAFAWQGDIFVVSSEGGQARQITSNSAYESDPLWTPDGRSVIFTSFREDSKDIFVTSSEGGTPRRISRHTGSEVPLAVLPDGTILFNAGIQTDPLYNGFPGDAQLYQIPFGGGLPRLVTPLTFSAVSVNPDGVVLYEDNKGYEDPFRKHHTSSVTHDIWMYTPSADAAGFEINEKGTFTKITDFNGEDRNPVFASDGKTYYFLSERDGSFNIYRSSIEAPSQVSRITSFDTHPVRYMSVAGNGLISFSYDGSLYTVRDGEEPKKLDIFITKDRMSKEVSYTSVSLGITSMAVSPNGKEVAIVARGDVFVTSIENNISRRITNTPVQERNVCFSKDGRTLYYDSERNGHWGIYESSLVEKDDKYFAFAYRTEEKMFSPEGETCYDPKVSPDGEWMAYLRNRTELVIRNIKSGKEKSLHKDINYSYFDGDQEFRWAPDSRHILSTWMAFGGWNNSDVALIDIESGEITNLTESGYSDGVFNWGMGGKAMTWNSDKAGFRSHGSWGSEDDIYIMFFDEKAYADYNRKAADEEILKLISGEDEKDKKKKKEKKDTSETDKEKKVEKLKLDLEDRHSRIVRVTGSSGTMGPAWLNDDGTKLYYVANREFRRLDTKKGESKVLSKGVRGNMTISSDGKYAFFCSRLGVERVDLGSGSGKSIKFKGDYDYRPAQEREYIFDHCWKLVNEKFYDPEIHGIDWKMYYESYKKFLPYIDNNYDFQELLSEMLGELNGSHTGARYRALRGGQNSGKLGLIYERGYEGDGLKIAEVLKGGPVFLADPEIRPGDMITAIEGREIKAGEDWYDMLRGKDNRRIQITVKKKGRKPADIMVTPVPSESELLYRRWVKRNEEMVEKLSGGLVGYVHVKAMDSPSFREVYSKLLGRYRSYKAVIVDTRHNGGGWLHDDLATLLGGKEYLQFRPRGQYVSSEPFSKWTKPSCVVMGEDNYSDASGFPYVYRALGIGKLIGAPVPGTMTAVWWESQLDPTLIFGIPQVGTWGMEEGRYLENLQIEPDITVYNDPASTLRGEDRQLEAAVAEMLKEIGKN